MKNLILLFTVAFLSASVFAQPDPRRVPPHSKPKPTPVAETPDTVEVLLDAKAAPCQMTAADAPIIAGIKLASTPDELSKAFKIKVVPGEPNALEVSTFDIGEKSKNSSALPKGITFIRLLFFNNRLYAANIVFDNALQKDAPPKQTLDKFVLALSEKYKFSKAWYRPSHFGTSTDDSRIYLFCPPEVRFSSTFGYQEIQLEIINFKTFAQITQRRKQTNNSKPQ